MKKILLSLGLSFALVFSSCNNELDVLTDYTETMVVFGLLNPTDTVQYIKVNKAFLGENDALVMSGFFDSSNYVNNELIVKLHKIVNGNITQTVSLIKETLVPKPVGVFSSPLQYLYKTNLPILQDGSEYKIDITNTVSGLSVTSKTKIVQNFFITNPTSSQTVNFISPVPFKIKWTSTNEGRLYDVVLRINYKETYVADPSQVAFKAIDMPLGNQRSTSLTGGEVMTIDFEGESFYRFAGNNIFVNPSVNRNFLSIDFVFTVAGEDFSTYMDVTQSGINSFQTVPVYSNINGGIGLFSSRFTKKVFNIQLNPVSLDTLKNGQFTGDLGFQ